MSDKGFYIGYTKNLKQRHSQHLNGKVKSTKNRRPLILLGYEAYQIKEDAYKREKYLKSSDAKKEIKIRFKETIQSLLS